jgi:hypothetical protein
MKLPEKPHRSGVSTLGITGVVLMTGVIWNELSAWWLILAVLLILSAVGSESK